MDYMVDIIIVIILIMGAVQGYKYGIFRSLISLVGMILVFILAFNLKDYLAPFLYDNLPFVNFVGTLTGLSSLNIVLYEGLAFLVVLVILSVLLNLIISITGIIDKITNATIVLALPSKLCGMVIGVVQYYIICFALLLMFSLFPSTKSYIDESNFAGSIINDTPYLSDTTQETFKTIDDIYTSIKNDYDPKNTDVCDAEIFDLLLKYKVVTPDDAEKIIKQDKISFEGASEIVNNYK